MANHLNRLSHVRTMFTEVEITMVFIKSFQTLMAAIMWFLLTTKPVNRSIYVRMQIANIITSVATPGFLMIILKFGQSHVIIRYSLYITRGHPLLTLKKPISTEVIGKHSMNWKTEKQLIPVRPINPGI